MKIPVITIVDTAAVVEAALARCYFSGTHREAFELGAKMAMLALSEEMALRMETLRLESEGAKP